VIGTLVYAPTLVEVQGTYDEVNRLCAEIGDKYHWAFVNINLRPYYAEGSKTMGYEIAEQLGWRAPAHVVVPCAGGSLLTKIAKAFQELARLGLISQARTRMYAAQAAGCGPIVTMIKKDTDVLEPVATADHRQVGLPSATRPTATTPTARPRTRAATASTPPTRRSSTGCGCSPAPRGSSRRPPAG